VRPLRFPLGPSAADYLFHPGVARVLFAAFIALLQPSAPAPCGVVAPHRSDGNLQRLADILGALHLPAAGSLRAVRARKWRTRDASVDRAETPAARAPLAMIARLQPGLPGLSATYATLHAVGGTCHSRRYLEEGFKLIRDVTCTLRELKRRVLALTVPVVQSRPRGPHG